MHNENIWWRSHVGLATVAVAFLAGGLAEPAAAQRQGDTNHEWCDRDDRNRGNREDRYCEVREFTMSARDLLRVDAGPNGGIEVEGWSQNEIRVVAKVQAWDRDGDTARDIARDIVIESDRSLTAEGPRSRGRDRFGWSVSYRLMVPNGASLDLASVNGGISATDINGDIEFSAVNGGIHLEGVGGTVRGRTVNGGIHVELDGDEWNGTGLDVETTNGGVTLYIPEDFKADLETGTVNGGFEIDFPIVVQGRINRRRIRTELNGGGPLIRVVTTNGGVTVRKGGME